MLYRPGQRGEIGSKYVKYRAPLLFDEELQVPRTTVEPSNLLAVRPIHV